MAAGPAACRGRRASGGHRRDRALEPVSLAVRRVREGDQRPGISDQGLSDDAGGQVSRHPDIVLCKPAGMDMAHREGEKDCLSREQDRRTLPF